MAAVGHGGLKESQVVNRLHEVAEKNKLDITDDNILEIWLILGHRLTEEI